MSEPSGNTGELGGTATPAERDPAFANQMRRTTAMVLKSCERWLVAARQHMDAGCTKNARVLAVAANRALFALPMRELETHNEQGLQLRAIRAMDRAIELLNETWEERV